VNLPARWNLNSYCVPVLSVPLEGPERFQEIHRRRALLPPHLRHDPAYAIAFPNWDTFSRWEWNAKRRTGYLGDIDWDRQRVPEASSDDEDEEEEGDEDDDEEGVGTGVGGQAKQPPPPPRVTGKVSGHIYSG
jgi:hypothetical protein